MNSTSNPAMTAPMPVPLKREAIAGLVRDGVLRRPLKYHHGTDATYSYITDASGDMVARVVYGSEEIGSRAVGVAICDIFNAAPQLLAMASAFHDVKAENKNLWRQIEAEADARATAERRLTELTAELEAAKRVDPRLVAGALAHRACCGTEHDAANGKLHGFCVVCGVPWPCDPAKSFYAPAAEGKVRT